MSTPNPQPHHKSRIEVITNKHRLPKVHHVTEEVVKVYVWELPVRVFHWINAACIVILMLTGIYIANPFFGSTIQEEAYYSFVMGWARYIHFFTAFLFTLNLLVRWYWVAVGNQYATSNPLKKGFWKETWETLKFYLFLKNEKPHYVGHNPLAQLSYWIFIGIGSLIIMFTGYYLLFEPQLESWLGKLFIWVPYLFGGDSFTIRSWHHLVAWGFMIFMIIHIYMAWREDYLQRNGTMSSIITGYKTEPKESVGDNYDEITKKK
ncbi:Ni/Fe-hydrogenase, b-type cytochrome subunit [Bacillus sp. HMF5848]|uniref:Ni/Fe-hydrogenase, b-type cytochrome subunit n=1 Tax=Bacillus sp. HMF5848 TaxID=2495421 RepID=UPI000F775BA5|nr:Ni/Fe-hydrogenase, b-type cytochrome subunit [Bacillus sp. HMF5848]RSK27296.1 Ni/Fe-hydrogenase, b-type cytochrome subunit [Bacillus sp. HMF5848]